MQEKEMQEKVKVGYYDFRKFLTKIGMLKESEKRLSKRVLKEYGYLPKSCIAAFEKEIQGHPGTLMVKCGWGNYRYLTQKEQEELSTEFSKLDFSEILSQIAEDCGDYLFFSKICQERQSMDQKQIFTKPAEIERFLCSCFSFSEQIRSYVARRLSGNLKIHFEAFKQDLLETFKEYTCELHKAFCKLEPYCVDGNLVFTTAPNTSTPNLPDKETIKHFCNFLKKQESQDKPVLTRLIDILLKSRLGKRLMRLSLERDCGLITYMDENSKKNLREAGIPFVKCVDSAQNTDYYYFPVAFRLWAFARLKEILKGRGFKGCGDLKNMQKALLRRLKPEQQKALCGLREKSTHLEFWGCVRALLSHLQLPLHVLENKETWQVDKVSGLFSLAISLNKEPIPEHEINKLLSQDDTEINQDSKAIQKEQSPLMFKTTQEESDEEEEEEIDEEEPVEEDEPFFDFDENEFSNVEVIRFYEDEPYIYTPTALYAYLSCISGQEEAKRALCTVLSDHHARFNDKPCMPKTNTLLIGPSGSGKTLITTTLLKILKIPCHIVDATSLTPTGWKGEETTNMFAGLYVSAGKDTKKAQKGVIFIDEVDKLGMEVTNEQFKSLVQTELLKPMEGHAVTFTYDKQEITLNTDKILFIFAGHFKDLYTNLDTNTQPKNSIGFINTNTKPTPPSVTQEVSSQDLQRCGLIKEFIGRIGYKVVLEPVNREMIYDGINNELKPYKDNFRDHNSALEVTKEAMDILANQVLEEGTGMRGIKTILSQVINPLRFDMKKWQGYKCIIIAETLTRGKEPLKFPL
ncbi:AAA family ATPase [Helicobacter suis]|uniref:AAA family ATPase n=1 Tax=Helicobacter suis TaxID=104628 RepID=UPI001F07C0B7|nr:AAA family ATPase [Helicobacter suis]